MFSINMSPGFHLGPSAGCPKLGPMKLSWGWWLMGLVPPLKTLEVSIDMVHSDDGTGGMVFATSPWKALGSLNPSMQVGLMSGSDVSWVLLDMTRSAHSHVWVVVRLCKALWKQTGLTTVCTSPRLGLTCVE